MLHKLKHNLKHRQAAEHHVDDAVRPVLDFADLVQFRVDVAVHHGAGSLLTFHIANESGHLKLYREHSLGH